MIIPLGLARSLGEKKVYERVKYAVTVYNNDQRKNKQTNDQRQGNLRVVDRSWSRERNQCFESLSIQERGIQTQDAPLRSGSKSTVLFLYYTIT
jgi:hypothetical protein